MKRLAGYVALCALATVFAMAAYAGDKPGQIKYEEYTLDNGLRVILSEDKSVPIVAINLWYHVGSAHEDEGRSGFAHLFEHMMFQETENIGIGEYFQWIAWAGGTKNGTTNQDRTNYFETLPANRLNLGLWMESDRMQGLIVTDASFENERETVKEERRMRIDNQPYGAAFLTSDTLAFDFKPYSHTVIGKMVDLDNATTDDVKNFYSRYYRPNNCVLVVVGDIDKKKTKKMIEEYFGDIPRGEDVPKLSGTEPMHKAERRKVIDDPNANVPAIFMSYNIPPHSDPDTPALELLGNILTDGESSRMYRRLVKDEEAAVVVFGGVDSRLGPGLFRFVAASNVGVDISTCEELMDEELEKLKAQGIDEKELEKAKIQFKYQFISGRQTCMQKAEALQHYAYYHNDLAEINTDLDKYMAVTMEDIMRVAAKYFVKNNRTTVIANPASKESS